MSVGLISAVLAYLGTVWALGIGVWLHLGGTP